MQMIERGEARKQGLKVYYTGIPCKHGHDSPRYTSNRMCVACARQDATDRWTKTKDSDRFKGDGPYCPLKVTTRREAIEQNLEYYFTGESCKKGHISPRKVANHTCVECQYEIYHNNPQKYTHIQAARRKNNKTTIKNYHRDRWQKRKRLPEEKALRKRERQHNKATRLLNDANRRATKLQATPSWFVCDDTRRVYETCVELTQATGIVHHVHHVVPLQSDKNVCGLHVADNLIILTEDEHRWFHAKPERVRLLW